MRDERTVAPAAAAAAAAAADYGDDGDGDAGDDGDDVTDQRWLGLVVSICVDANHSRMLHAASLLNFLVGRGCAVLSTRAHTHARTQASTTTESILEIESTLHSHFPNHPEDAAQRQMLSVLQKVEFEVCACFCSSSMVHACHVRV